MAHLVTISETAADLADTYGARAFCETCPWASEWVHADSHDEHDVNVAYDLAASMGEQHVGEWVRR